MKTKNKTPRPTVEDSASSKKPRGLKHHPFVVPILTFFALFFMTAIGLVLFNGLTV